MTEGQKFDVVVLLFLGMFILTLVYLGAGIYANVRWKIASYMMALPIQEKKKKKKKRRTGDSFSSEEEEDSYDD